LRTTSPADLEISLKSAATPTLILKGQITFQTLAGRIRQIPDGNLHARRPD
jgi:hypothetical protein